MKVHIIGRKTAKSKDFISYDRTSYIPFITVIFIRYEITTVHAIDDSPATVWKNA